MFLLALGIIVISVSLAIILVGASSAQRRVPDARSTFLRIAAGSGVMSLCAALLYMFEYSKFGEAATSAASYTALVLAPALMAVAVCAEQQRIARYATVFAGIAGLIVACACTLMTAAAGLPVLLTVLAFACMECALLALFATALPRAAMLTLAGTSAFYGVFCAARATALLIFGSQFAPTEVFFGFTPSLLAALITYLVIAGAVISVLLSTRRTARRRSLESVHLTISDWPLVVAAYGYVRAAQLLEDLREAARDLDPLSADVKHGAAITLTSPIRRLTETLMDEYGWRPEETSLLVVSAQPG